MLGRQIGEDMVYNKYADGPEPYPSTLGPAISKGGLRSHLNEQGCIIEELMKVVQALEAQLAPITIPSPERAEKPKDVGNESELVHNVRIHNQMIISTLTRLNDLRDNLQI